MPSDAPTHPPVLDATSDIIVVSDFHIGRGHNPATSRFHTLEAFFYDEDFLSFCRYLCTDAKSRNVAFTLVLNGDIFDLLRVDPEPSPHATSLTERRYGAPNTPETAPRVVHQILAGHSRFVRALTEVLAAGNHVVMLAGNHDIESEWEPVRSEVRAAIVAELAAPDINGDVEDCLARLVFRSWFYYVPGRVWIEHGSQYDPANAFKYFLRGNLTDVSQAVYAAEHDMPLGNFFQRYLYNAFGHITFIVPDARANLRYMRWFLLNEPRFLFRVLARHVPFAAMMLRRAAKSEEPAKQLEHAHQHALARIAESTGLGDKLRTIDQLKEVRVDAAQAAQALITQLLKTSAIAGIMMLGALLAWFVGFLVINDLQGGLAWRALLFMFLNFAMLLLAGGIVAWRLLRPPPVWKAKPLLRAAQALVNILDVPLVVFGHTHVETVTRLVRKNGEPAWYFNTGTWIAVFTHDELIPRERVQQTFLRIRGNEGELLFWSPERGVPLKVVLLDESPLSAD
ncbi:MAG: hypothetical protein AAB426_05860 [Myxococcota bacterium]|mgnify:CR=1 FL=1